MEEKTTIRADVAKNRMYIRLTGSYTVDDTIPVINRINCEVVKLKPGFGVINDIRELKKSKHLHCHPVPRHGIQ